MRKIYKIVIFSITILILFGSNTYSYIDVYVDPGHGGSDPGTVSSFYPTLYEKNVNLVVALKLVDNLEGFGDTYYMSRDTDEYMGIKYRAYEANDLEAQAFISIHHNGDNDTSIQYTAALIDTIPETDGDFPGLWRDTDPLLAEKIGYRIQSHFNYNLHKPHPWKIGHDFTVLSRSTMVSTITEASYITTNDEGTVFYNELQMSNPDNQIHINGEALAIYEGYRSWCDGQGIGRVDYHYNRLTYLGVPVATQSPEPTVYVDTTNWNVPEREYFVPFQTCWLLNEFVRLEAKDFSLLHNQGSALEITYDYTFHHWEKKWYTTDWQLETFYDKIISFNVPFDMEGDHYYVAYFTGGPYELEIISDSVPNVVLGDLITLDWNVDKGVDSTTQVSVNIKRDNGNWEELTIVPWEDNWSYFSYDWTASGTPASVCQFKLHATDTAGNSVETYSNSFSICDPSIDTDCDFFYANDNCPNNYNPNQLNTDGDAWGNACDNCIYVYNPDQADVDNDGIGNLCDPDYQCSEPPVAAYTYTFVPGPATAVFYGYDQSGNYLTTIWDFGDGSDPDYLYNVIHNYYISGVYTITHTVENSCGSDDTTFTIVFPCHLTTDSDGDGLDDNDCDNCPTTYNPDQLDSNGDGVGDACCCVGIRGNVDGSADDIVNISDLNYLVAYAFQEGPAPICMEEADVNCSGGVNVTDLIYLVDYMFQNGPAPCSCP